jgi:hypothetical protein
VFRRGDLVRWHLARVDEELLGSWVLVISEVSRSLDPVFWVRCEVLCANGRIVRITLTSNNELIARLRGDP